MSLIRVLSMVGVLGAALAVSAEAAEKRVLLWGDTHLHTKYSGDAYAMRNWSVTPDDAFRFARGEPVVHPFSKTRVQMKTPLDFLVVTDHAEYMGVMQMVETLSPELQRSEVGRLLLENRATGNDKNSFFLLAGSLNKDEPIKELLTAEIRQPIWDIITGAADRNNEPGKFTAFIGWEWSSLPEGANLHRIVFTPDNAKKARNFLPFSSLSDNRPEGLFNWLDRTSASEGVRFVAIPHNSNISRGLMFSDVMSDGAPIDSAYAAQRMKWEPVVEMTQVKGTSETHPSLSPEDPFADFELYEKVMNFNDKMVGNSGTRGNYVRDSLRRGLEIQNKIGANPYQFGMIGASDMHTGLSSVEEDNFYGKFAIDGVPENKFDRELTPNAYGVDMSAAGIAAVWAEENTRTSIYEAFRRKEVYATTGPRIQLRMFGGWSFSDGDAQSAQLADIGYSKGVPMGGDLPPAPQKGKPSFLLHASKDPQSGNLERIQMIKGWVDASGQSHERIYDVALSDGRSAKGAQLTKALDSTVDGATATYRNDIGAAQLAVRWEDPDFDPTQAAFYYARVIEIATPRHSLYDAVALQRDHSKNHPTEVRERAFSSPIWYTPAK